MCDQAWKPLSPHQRVLWEEDVYRETSPMPGTQEVFTSYKVLSLAWRKFQLPGRDLKPTKQRRKFRAYQIGKMASCHMKVKVLVTQSCLILSDRSLPGSSVHRILQAGILEWVATLFSRGSSWPRDRTRVSCIAGRFFTIWATREAPFMPWTVTK